MALPWLIGGLIVGGIAVAAKLSSDNDSGGYDDDDNDYEEEERRRAARERKKRALDQKIESLMSEVKAEGERRASMFQADLSPVLEVEYSSYRPYAGEIDEAGDLDQTYDSMMQYELDPEFVPEKTQDNLERFVELYHVQTLKAAPHFAKMQARLTSMREACVLLAEKHSALLALYESLDGDATAIDQSSVNTDWQLMDKKQSTWEDRWNGSLTTETNELQAKIEELRKVIGSLRD